MTCGVRVLDADEYLARTSDVAQGEQAGMVRGEYRRIRSDLHLVRPLPPGLEGLPVEAAQVVADRWSKPCEAAFEYLASRHPESLLAWIDSGLLSPTDLTFAAEYAGRIEAPLRVRACLLPLLGHPEAFVREGVIYGLTRHVDDSVRVRLRDLAKTDPSPSVRDAATEALETA